MAFSLEYIIDPEVQKTEKDPHDKLMQLGSPNRIDNFELKSWTEFDH